MKSKESSTGGTRDGVLLPISTRTFKKLLSCKYIVIKNYNEQKWLCLQGCFKGSHSGSCFSLIWKAVQECSTSTVKTTFSSLRERSGNEEIKNTDVHSKMVMPLTFFYTNLYNPAR